MRTSREVKWTLGTSFVNIALDGWRGRFYNHAMKQTILVIIVMGFLSLEAASATVTSPADCRFHLDPQIVTMKDIRDALPFLKISNEGTVAFDDDGFPNRISYAIVRAATKLAAKTFEWRRDTLSRDDYQLLHRLSRHYFATDALIWGEGNAELVENYYLGRGGIRENMPLPWWILVQRRAYERGDWWMSDRSNLGLPYGSPPLITVNTSQSTVLQATGAFGSHIHWSLANHGIDLSLPDMMGPHVRINEDENRKEKSMELFVPKEITKTTGWGRNKKVETTIEWKAFLFERYGDLILPRVARFDKRPATDCIRCHATINERGETVLTPRPMQLATKADFRKSGYQDDHIIDAFEKAFPIRAAK